MYKYLYHVHCNSIHNTKETETTDVSINERTMMNGQKCWSIVTTECYSENDGRSTVFTNKMC